MILLRITAATKASTRLSDSSEYGVN